MVIQIKKWGNSLGLRIPRDIARTMGLEEGSEVSLEVVDGQLIAKPTSDLRVIPSQGKFAVRRPAPISGKPGGKTVQQIIREMWDEGW